MPRVSVLIPCFNLGAFIRDAIDSVLAQTYTDYEVIVVDDGSTDADTIRRLDALAHEPIRLVRSEHRGLSAARNLGTRHSTGEFLCSVDADDRLSPDWIARGVAVLDAEPDVAFVSHWLATFGDEAGTWTPAHVDLGVLLDRNVINGAALVRRDLVTEVGGWDESMREGCEDWEFWIRLAAAGHRGVIVPEVHYHYRSRAGSMSRQMSRGDTDLNLYTYIIERHPDVFRSQLEDLLLRREWSLSAMWRRQEDTERALAGIIEPALDERRRELAEARTRVEHARAAFDLKQRAAELQVLADRQRDEANEQRRRADSVSATLTQVRQSWSWRATAPLRRLYERAGFGARASHDL
jgi:glycosyltransferase involved in cell wall biosynthesis